MYEAKMGSISFFEEIHQPLFMIHQCIEGAFVIPAINRLPSCIGQYIHGNRQFIKMSEDYTIFPLDVRRNYLLLNDVLRKNTRVIKHFNHASGWNDS